MKILKSPEAKSLEKSTEHLPEIFPFEEIMSTLSKFKILLSYLNF